MESNAAAGGGRGRGNRGGRSRRKNPTPKGGGGGGGGGSVQKKGGVPPPPQLKLAVRHIGNPTVYGTTKAVLEDLLIPLIASCNAKSLLGVPPASLKASTSVATSSQCFVLEMDSIAKRHLIDEEEATREYLKEWQRKQSLEETTTQDVTSAEGDGGLVATTSDLAQNEEGDHGETQTFEGMQVEQVPATLDVVVAPPSKPPPGIPVISLRPLYVIPPKTSRRRGDRPGAAYILLTAPKIEKVEIPETVPENGIPSVVSQENNTSRSTPKTSSTTTTVQENSENSSKPVENSAEGSKIVAKVTTTDSVSGKNPSVTSAKKQTDYSRQVAQGSLLLQTATDLLKEVISTLRPSWMESGKDASPVEAGTSISMVIEPAMSGKTWRWQNSRSDRRENTLETTADYKNWLAGLEKREADLKARPKPAPGGGAPTNDESGNAPTTAQPIAALVQHLIAKQQELKRKKVKNKKESTGTTSAGAKDGKTTKGGKGVSKNPKKTTKSGAKSEAATSKQPKNRRAKKKGAGGISNPKAVAPTSLLDAPASNK